MNGQRLKHYRVGEAINTEDSDGTDEEETEDASNAPSGAVHQ